MKIPGEIASQEIEGSTAPLLLSIHAQQVLGLVVDFENMTIYSKTLKCSFEAVRGRKNKLLGLRISKAEWNEDEEACIAMMAAGEEDEEEDENRARGSTEGTKEESHDFTGSSRGTVKRKTHGADQGDTEERSVRTTSKSEEEATERFRNRGSTMVEY